METAVVALVVVVIVKDLAWVGAVVNMLVEALVINDVMSNVLSGDKGGVDMFNMLADMGIIVVTAAVMALKFGVSIRSAVDMLSDVVVDVLFGTVVTGVVIAFVYSIGADMLADVNANAFAAATTVFTRPTLLRELRS